MSESLFEEYIKFMRNDASFLNRIISECKLVDCERMTELISETRDGSILLQIEDLIHSSRFLKKGFNDPDFRYDDYKREVFDVRYERAELLLREYYQKIPRFQEEIQYLISKIHDLHYVPTEMVNLESLTFSIPTHEHVEALKKINQEWFNWKFQI